LPVSNESGFASQLNSGVEPPARDELRHVVVTGVLSIVVRRIDVQQIDWAESGCDFDRIRLMRNRSRP